VLCLTYTFSPAHSNAVQSIRQTWGKKCDGYLAMSNLTDPEIPSVNIKHLGPEAYDYMWAKVQSIWLYIYKHHLTQYDYFIIGGDDLFVLVENLRLYLQSDEIVGVTLNGTKPIFLGRRFKSGEVSSARAHTTRNIDAHAKSDTYVYKSRKQMVFNSGGAGYVLNSAAVEVLARGLKARITGCNLPQVRLSLGESSSH
jgi:glycoprotein-N-acetylgalactosamine 3-beta-galactosyltransferase